MEKGIYKHNKSGNEYELLHIALVEFNKDKVAVYKGVTSGVIWVRDLKQFEERFTFIPEKKDCKDGQHSGETGKCSECGKTYIHGVK